MTQQSNKQPGGRYSQGGKVDDFVDRLGWWERKVFPPSSTDVSLTLTAEYNRRPDVLAYDLYGKAGLQWFILQYNTISDITTFEQGLTIIVPTRARLFNELLSNVPSRSPT